MIRVEIIFFLEWGKESGVESPVKKEIESHNRNRNAQWLEERMERMEVNSVCALYEPHVYHSQRLHTIV